MVLASLNYFERISFILVSTSIFAAHHFIGYFAYPELICGTEHYPFGLLMIHAIFLLITAGVTIIQLSIRKRHDKIVVSEKEKQMLMINRLIHQILETSQQLTATVEILDSGTKDSARASNDIFHSISQMVTGVDKQKDETERNEIILAQIDTDVQQVIEQINQSVQVSENTKN